MQDSDVNMQHNYADMQKGLQSIKMFSKNIKCLPNVTSNMQYAT